MSGPIFYSHRRGHLVTGDDSVDQAVAYNQIVCITAGNFKFTMIDPVTGAETATMTLAMTAGMVLQVTPKKIPSTNLTGTYLGVVAA